jgi:hypothetical protein
MKITYKGDYKPYYQWIYETFSSYMAACRLFISFFKKYCRTFGIRFILRNLDLVADSIPWMFQEMIKIGKEEKQ